MSSPYANYPPFYHRRADSSSATNRRPSYATVAASTSGSGPSSFQSLAGIANQGQSGGQARPPTRGLQESGGAEDRDKVMGRGMAGVRGAGMAGFEDGVGAGRGERGGEEMFFVPSYLRQSRHVGRLRRAWERRIEEGRREVGGGKDGGGDREREAVSREKSGQSVHRGVASEVVERVPVQDDGTHALPSRWNEEDKMSGLEVLGDGTEVRFSGIAKGNDEAASIRADRPMPREVGLYYFEVTIMSKAKDGLIGVGFSGKKTTLHRLPGWEHDSWAYHGDDGFKFSCSANGAAYGPRFSAQDVVGCGVNFRTGDVFFTKNGVYLGTAFNGIRAEGLYPSIGIKKLNEHLRANFGRQPFVFDIDSMMAAERKAIRAELNGADVSSLHPPDDENALIHKLISQYLAHEGYVETSRAFAADIRKQASFSTNTAATSSASSPSVGDDDDDMHAINRQKIRKAILDGNIDKALKYTLSYYPLVFQDDRNKDIYFRLRCRKFIEMMRRYSELQTSPDPSNGHEDREAGEVTQMDLDDQLQRSAAHIPPPPPPHAPPHSSTEDVDMDTSTSSLPPKSTALRAGDYLSAALQYGQELQVEFGADARLEVKRELNELFAMVAYHDPRESVVGGLLDKRGRGGIAEGVNGAILVFLGKPSSAALEKLCAQTEALLDVAAANTGCAAAFVNVGEDFLHP